ncbi:hypothetical protein [Paeniglutamicibacter sp. Y32M11]|nr:hypothetical protein KUF55_09210 [Paeniglutamicibacter sp. Y32M11]
MRWSDGFACPWCVGAVTGRIPRDCTGAPIAGVASA